MILGLAGGVLVEESTKYRVGAVLRAESGRCVGCWTSRWSVQDLNFRRIERTCSEISSRSSVVKIFYLVTKCRPLIHSCLLGVNGAKLSTTISTYQTISEGKGSEWSHRNRTWP